MATTNKVKGWTGVLMTEDSSSHWPIKRRYVYSETSRRTGLEFVCIFGHDARGSEVHFVCEEVPTIESSACEGGRYLHAIYQPSEAVISHFDLAVRIYSHSEVIERHKQHVRHAGKVGLRKKVLRIDELVPRAAFSSVCQAFFVWNHDVRRYFEDGCTPDSAGRTGLS